MTTTVTAQQPTDSKPAPKKQAYRKDLDGLRGIAIGLVVLFHVFVGRVSGGVDVFLLLSGYFFMGSQLRYAMRPNPSLNPWWPLWRTARRLLPALAVVLAAIYAGIRWLTPEIMSQDLAKQFTASVLYFQNYELASQNLDYAAAGAETSPLQHLWSMSVQGQFYVFAITTGVIVAFLASRVGVSNTKLRRGIIALLAVLAVASFAYASRHGLVGTPKNYYEFPSRLWELAFGALLAMLPVTNTIPEKLRGAAAALGVAAIAVTGAIITTSLAFPGPAALIPLLGAALVVMAGPDQPVARVLSSGPILWLGKVAYSLYLWHWPLLILFTVKSGRPTPTVALGVLVIVLSLCLAHLTYTLVEDPLRQHGKRPKAGDTPVRTARASLATTEGRGRAVGGALIGAILLGVLSIQPLHARQVDNADFNLTSEKYPGAMANFGEEVPEAQPQPDPNLIADIFPPTADDNCIIFMDQPADMLPGPHCVWGDPEAEATVVLFGGSHSEPWLIPLDELGKEHGFKVMPMVRQSCPLILDDLDTVSPECAEWSRLAFNTIIEMKPDLTISTATRPEGRAGEGSPGPDIVPSSYATLWEELQANDIPFLGMRDNPWVFSREGAHMDPNECLIAGNDFEACSTLRDTVYGGADPSAEYLFPENKQWGLDTSDWFCDDELCPPIIGNVYVYRDQNHVSNAYAATTAPLLWAKLQEVFAALGTPVKGLEQAPALAPEQGSLTGQQEEGVDTGDVGKPSVEANPDLLPELGDQ